MDEDDVRRNERIRQDEARKYEFKGCLKIVLVILVVSLAMGACAAIFCTPDRARAPPYPTPRPYLFEPTTAPRAIATATAAPTQALTRLEACVQVWEYIYYVADGFVMDGLSPQDALDTAIVGVMQAHNLTADDMDGCLDLLEQAGY